VSGGVPPPEGVHALPGREKIAVMQVTDSLDAGGMERVAVNIANSLPLEAYVSHICTTRREGQLASAIAPHVRRLNLARRSTVDPAAVARLAAYCREERIAILHAHASSLFIAALAAAIVPRVKLIWHDHYGAHETHERPAFVYRMGATQVDGVIAVSRPLAEWSVRRLGVPISRVRYIPNFVALPGGADRAPDLPGVPGGRILCVANLRPQKDHLNLIRAMRIVAGECSSAHLILLGVADDAGHLERIRREIADMGLSERVTWLGSRDDVHAVMRACDVGVLSSASEGLPLALIEYGMARLASVATSVGQCAEVLDGGRAGVLVPPRSPEALARALTALLRSAEERQALGARLEEHVRREYSAASAMERITAFYDEVLRGSPL